MANEENTAGRFIDQVISVCRSFQFKTIHFFLVLDNASTDGTQDLVKQLSQSIPELKIIFAPENKNVVDAYQRGYREAIADKVDWILEIDAGFSHRPVDIPKFFETMISGNYDCVFGSRFSSGGKMEHGTLKKFVISLGGTMLTNVLLGTKLRDMNGGFELFKRETLIGILDKGILSQGPFFQTEIRAFAHRFKIIEVPIIYDASTGHARQNELPDAFKNLKRLFLMRLKGEL